MGIVLRYAIFSEYAQVSVAVYIWYSLAGCVGGLSCYWGLITLYYRVSIKYSSTVVFRFKKVPFSLLKITLNLPNPAKLQF